MGLVARSTAASLDTSTGMFAPQTTGNLYAGEVLDAVAACYIKQADGLVYMSNGTLANEAAKFDGFTARTCQIGEPVTLFGVGSRFRYGLALTVGADLYVAATKGRLDTAPTVGGLNPIARVLHNACDIRITHADERNQIASINGAAVKTVASADIVGGIPVLHEISLAAGALATTNVVLTYKTRVIDAWLRLDGAGVATTTLQLLNGVTALTDAMAASGAIKSVVRCAQIDATQQDIAAGGTLAVVSATGATQPAATVFVLGIRVP